MEHYFDSTEIMQDGEWVQGKIIDTICYLFYDLDSTESLQDGEWVQGKISNTICHLLEIFWSHNTII